MLVKLNNISIYRGSYTNSMKININSESGLEGGIELSGFLVDRYPQFADLRAGDEIDLAITFNLIPEKKEEAI